MHDHTLQHLRKLDNWVDVQHALWTRLGKGQDFVGAQSERIGGPQAGWTGSFEPLTGVHSAKRCLSCNNPLEPYLVMTPRPPRLGGSDLPRSMSQSARPSPRMSGAGGVGRGSHGAESLPPLTQSTKAGPSLAPPPPYVDMFPSLL